MKSGSDFPVKHLAWGWRRYGKQIKLLCWVLATAVQCLLWLSVLIFILAVI